MTSPNLKHKHKILSYSFNNVERSFSKARSLEKEAELRSHSEFELHHIS